MAKSRKDAPEPETTESGYGKSPRIDEVTEWSGQTTDRPFAFEGEGCDPTAKHALAIGHTPEACEAMKQRLHRKGYRPVPKEKGVYMRGVPNGQEGAEVWYTTPEIAAKHQRRRENQARRRLRNVNLATIEGVPLRPQDVEGMAGDTPVRPDFSMKVQGAMRDQYRRAEEARHNRNANLSEI